MEHCGTWELFECKKKICKNFTCDYNLRNKNKEKIRERLLKAFAETVWQLKWTREKKKREKEKRSKFKSNANAKKHEIRMLEMFRIGLNERMKLR